MATVIDRRGRPTWRDFLELTKPKVMMLMLVTPPIGMLLTAKASLDGPVPWQVLTFGNLGIGLCAGAMAAVNRVVDRRIGSTVARTHKWPLAEDRVSPNMALGFMLFLALTGMTVLLAFISPLIVWLTLASLLGYAAPYTGFLKRATPQDVVIGGLAGAASPLLGWVVITGHLSTEPLLLVLTIFVWTPPHFWVLCTHRKDGYARTDVPMLPVTHGECYIKLHILLYALVLFAVGPIPFVICMGGLVYLFCVLALGARFLDQAWALYCGSRPHAAIKTFKYSIVYLFPLFMALLVDHYLPLELFL